jgi:hypothetical protein
MKQVGNDRQITSRRRLDVVIWSLCASVVTEMMEVQIGDRPAPEGEY